VSIISTEKIRFFALQKAKNSDTDPMLSCTGSVPLFFYFPSAAMQ